MKTVSRFRGLGRPAQGQSLVEFAMVLPLLLVVAFIITEFGRALWIKNALTGAAGSAARAVIVSGIGTYEAVADSGANHFLVPMGMGIGDAGGTTIDTQIMTDAGSGKDYVSVLLSREFNFIPSGGAERALPTQPAAKGNRIPLGTVVITGSATMELQPSFQH